MYYKSGKQGVLANMGAKWNLALGQWGCVMVQPVEDSSVGPQKAKHRDWRDSLELRSLAALAEDLSSSPGTDLVSRSLSDCPEWQWKWVLWLVAN